MFIMPLTRVSYQYALGRKGHAFRKGKKLQRNWDGGGAPQIAFCAFDVRRGGGKSKAHTRRKEVFNSRGSLNQLKVEKKNSCTVADCTGKGLCGRFLSLSTVFFRCCCCCCTCITLARGVCVSSLLGHGGGRRGRRPQHDLHAAGVGLGEVEAAAAQEGLRRGADPENIFVCVNEGNEKWLALICLTLSSPTPTSTRAR